MFLPAPKGKRRARPIRLASPPTRMPAVDRRLAMKNLRTGLICGAVAVFVLAASFISGYVY